MKKAFLASAVLALALALYFTGAFHSLSLANLQAERTHWQGLVHEAPQLSAVIFFCLYFAITALSLPGAAVLTLSAGTLFGFWPGTLLVSFASSFGASTAFLLSRYFFRDWLKEKFATAFRELEKGFARDGDLFLLMLRLVPAFPFFVVNLVASWTPISLLRFYLLSQLAMFPATAIYVNAGTELGKLQKLSDVFSLRLIVAFTLLGIFPLAAKRLMQRWRNAREKQ